ncbi:MAG TPA: DUF695 domain-containing protein [Arcobacter sp.]|nr:DUF695 domain-containing protein [Arcobacter sp.]
MQEYWEVYMKPIEGYPTMVSFNAGVADEVPNPELMYVAFVKVKLHDPKENGLVTDEESNDVGFIEDRLELELLRWRSGKYIGRIISQGEVNFIYYLKMDFEWGDTVSAAMKHFPEYNYEFGSRMDIEWEVYQKLLFPTVAEWQIITNHHACNALKEKGDNLRIERAIEHKVYFKTDLERQNFKLKIKNEGFQCQKDFEVPFNNETMLGVQFYRIDSPFFYNIDDLTMKIIEISTSCNGMYDGWECSLVKI